LNRLVPDVIILQPAIGCEPSPVRHRRVLKKYGDPARWHPTIQHQGADPGSRPGIAHHRAPEQAWIAMPLLLQLPLDMGIPTSWNAAAKLVRENPAMRDAVEYFRRVLGKQWRGWQKHSHLARSFHTSFQDGAREWVPCGPRLRRWPPRSAAH
jgi:hypothetical protein